MGCIEKYFPCLSSFQLEKFQQLENLYRYWNKRINVISRKDIDNLYLHHILYSLSVTKVIYFKVNTSVLDVGTGGGFPGIPLAVFFPDCQFHLIDATGKKIKVVNEIAKVLQLKNLTASHIRIEDFNEKFDFVTGRALMPLSQFYEFCRKNVLSKSFNVFKNGMFYWKGGEIGIEIEALNCECEIFDISAYFTEVFFETKKIIYLKR